MFIKEVLVKVKWFDGQVTKVARLCGLNRRIVGDWMNKENLSNSLVFAFYMMYL